MSTKLFKSIDEIISGGKGDKKSLKSFSPEQVAMGLKVEMEHTNDKEIAEEITADHLSEDPHYYSKLKESGLADELEKGINGNWKKEGYKISHSNPDDYCEDCAVHSDTEMRVSVAKDGKEVAHAHIKGGHPSRKALWPSGISVDSAHRRKGIASAMYQYAENFYKKPIEPSDARSDDARSLWSNPNRPFGKSESFSPQQVWEHRMKYATPQLSEREWNQPQNATQKENVFKHPEYELTHIPLSSIKIDGSHPSQALNDKEDEMHAHKYARLDTNAPAILLHPDEHGNMHVKDGRHRTRAAAIKGQSHILAFVPKINKTELEKNDDIVDNSSMKAHLKDQRSFANADDDLLGDVMGHSGHWEKKNIPLNSVRRQHAYHNKDQAPSGTEGPIVVHPKGHIIDGNHRHAEAERQGHTHIEAWVPKLNKMHKSEISLSDLKNKLETVEDNSITVDIPESQILFHSSNKWDK